MYQNFKQPGTTNSQGDMSPAGIYVGLGTRISNTQLDMSAGSLNTTGGNLDVGITGNGFFRVKILNSIGDGTGYTRNGSFFQNAQGQLSPSAWETAIRWSPPSPFAGRDEYCTRTRWHHHLRSRREAPKSKPRVRCSCSSL